MRLFRDFFEGKGWSPEQLSALTPKQLLGIAGSGRGSGARQTFGSLAEAAAHYRAERGR